MKAARIIHQIKQSRTISIDNLSINNKYFAVQKMHMEHKA